jgi:hypothetical protein
VASLANALFRQTTLRASLRPTTTTPAERTIVVFGLMLWCLLFAWATDALPGPFEVSTATSGPRDPLAVRHLLRDRHRHWPLQALDDGRVLRTTCHGSSLRGDGRLSLAVLRERKSVAVMRPHANQLSGSSRVFVPQPGELFDAEFAPQSPGTYVLRRRSARGDVAYSRLLTELRSGVWSWRCASSTLLFQRQRMLSDAITGRWSDGKR